MVTITTTAELRILNQQNIYNFIYKHKKISKQEISDALKLSLPTISQNLKELETMGLIRMSGSYESTGGRKAQAFLCCSNAKIAIGISIAKRAVQLIALNLYGEALAEETKPIYYRNSEKYYQIIGEYMSEFIEALSIPEHSILGIGIGLQGLVSSDGTTVTYGKILNCTGISIHNFQKYISYPCRMIHDAEAAAIAELWYRDDLTNAMYLYLNDNIGGAVIIDGELTKGREAKSGMFEHMTIVPEGRQCYCGKKGCLDAYCANESLLKAGETLEFFFKNLRNNETDSTSRWNDYLHYLSVAIDNIHMVIDSDVILGGSLAAYMNDGDLEKLRILIESNTAFPIEEYYVKKSCCNTFERAKGAAISYIKNFISIIHNSSSK